MAPDVAVREAVQVAIVAAAYQATYERLADAADACSRLGQLTSGRWRSAARDLLRLQDDLGRALETAGDDLRQRAEKLAVAEEALWTAGDAAGLFDLFRDDALDTLEGDSLAARLLESGALFGATFLENADVPNRGTTLLFGWADPLTPATWSWEGNWIASDEEEDGAEELDLSAVGGLQAGEALLAEVGRVLGVSPQHGEQALAEAAAALTRVSLLATLGDEDEEDAGDDGATNGHV